MKGRTKRGREEGPMRSERVGGEKGLGEGDQLFTFLTSETKPPGRFILGSPVWSMRKEETRVGGKCCGVRLGYFGR